MDIKRISGKNLNGDLKEVKEDSKKCNRIRKLGRKRGQIELISRIRGFRSKREHK